MHQEVTLCILAGGEGRRMGQPKGTLRIGAAPILQHLHDRFDWSGPTMLVTAPGREHPPAWEKFDREVVDPVARVGPLRGVLTALEHATTTLIVMATVDMPAVESRQLVFLADHLEAHPQCLGAMTRRQVDGADQIEPFPSAFRTQAREVVARALSDGRRSVYGLLQLPGFEALATPEDWHEAMWRNLNTPEDLEPEI